MITDEQRSIVKNNPKKVKCSAEMCGGLYAGLVNVATDKITLVTVARTGYEYEEADDAIDEAMEILERIKADLPIHSQVEIENEDEDDDDLDDNPDEDDDEEE